MVLLIAALAWWLQRSWKLALAVALGFGFIINQGFGRTRSRPLVLVVSATAASMAIGVPIGIWAAHNERGYRILQPIPRPDADDATFVYLIPVLILFGLGIAPGMIVTVIFACPLHRLTHPQHHLRAPADDPGGRRPFGATRKRQLLWKVELPAAYPPSWPALPMHHAVAVDGGDR